MMNKETINELQKNETLAALVASLSGIGTAAPVMVLPNGFSVEDLEGKMEFRTSYRAKYQTKSIEDFSEYSKEFAQEGSKCFVDSDDMTAKVIFDLGTGDKPLHQRHSGGLKIDRTAAFRALIVACNGRLTQKDAADFVEDWSDNVTVYLKDGSVITPGAAANKLRSITIEQVKNVDSKVDDFSESMSQFEKIEAKNQEAIPASIKFKCTPYHGLGEREFDIRLGILTGEQKPQISLRVIKLEAHEEDMAVEFKEILQNKLNGTEIKVFIGDC